MSDFNEPIDESAGEIDEAADAALLTELRAAAAVHDPLPGHLLEFARIAPEVRRMDIEIAELLDSEQLAGVRSSAIDSVMSFAGRANSIDIDISDGRLIGQLVPPQLAAIELEGPKGVLDSTTSDERGNFSFELPSGSVRIVATADEAITGTEWFVL